MTEQFPICKRCDAMNMPHTSYTDCKDNQIEWLKFKLDKAVQRIKFLEEIVGMKRNG